ncbi:hypothetical protein [Moheibacter sediminis]|uniref:HEAT repeat-containing protein n=1 Tax=Moheibacter sediminis TaxID=1434700 RepID=A0A1W2CV14_9FLAO|nr:hypothetical protein [Moheibacter sediminis]SMC88796.1 hypothetical protein SAMN06296427_11197 [Moheibacter sediminis]
MNIFHQLEKEHSKENSLSIVSYIGNDAERFHELMDCFFAETKDYRVPQRAAYTLSLTFDRRPNLILPYREKLIQNLENPQLKSSLKRNILRVLQFTEIKEEWMGSLYDNCFEFLENPKEEIAIRAFAMVVLYNISNTFPELKPELKSMIESVFEEPQASPGIRSKAKHILKKLYAELH